MVMLTSSAEAALAAARPVQGTSGNQLSTGHTGLWLAGNEGMEKEMETITMGYIGTTRKIHSFIPG